MRFLEKGVPAMRVSVRTRAPSLSVSTAPLVLVYLGLALVVTAWGGSFVAARALLHATTAGQVALSPTVLAALRFSLASLAFIVPLARAILRRQLSRGDLVRMAVLGQITYSTYFWLQYTGVQLTNAGISSILVIGLMPIATAIFARLLGVERLSWQVCVALLLGFAGVVLIVFQQGLSVGHDLGFALGALCLVGNAIAFAVYSNLSKRWMRTISPLVMTGGTMLSGALGLLALSLLTTGATQWVQVARLDGRQWFALLFLVVVCSVAAYFIYNAALTRIPASRAAVFSYFEPVVAVVLGALLLGERLSAQALLGAGIIALSIFLLQRGRRRQYQATHAQGMLQYRAWRRSTPNASS
ncbi:MAG TPA: EamA family transporter [Ktedonobacterales bacterium]|nr:EamA family transporter [Ktedonobacterales bacterium]